MSVLIVIRDRSFVFVEDVGDKQRTFIANRYGDTEVREVVAEELNTSASSEFTVDKVEARAVFGTVLDDNNERHLLICREADLACEIPAEGKFWQVTKCDLLAYDPGSVGGAESKSNKLLSSVRSFVSSGCFYFSELRSPLLTNSMQRVAENISIGDIFDWSKSLALNFSPERLPFQTQLLQGYVGQRRLFPLSAAPLLVTLIARRSTARAGTRFQARGLDDSGSVANFIESEILAHSEFSSELIFSHSQIRGSVPVFWTQSVGGAPEISRRRSMAAPAFQRHARFLRHGWGRAAYVDLLARGRENEAKLSEELWAQVESSGSGWYLGFDFHQLLAGSDSLTDGLRPLTQRLFPYLSNFGFFDPGNGKRQSGVVRTNCLDCLDRTNAVQLVLAWETLRLVPSLSLPIQPPSDFVNLWVEQGDQLSKIYTGSGSVLSRFLKSSGADKVAAFLEQTWRSAERLYDHHFDAGDRQTAIETLLRSQAGVATGQPTEVDVWVGTWNLGGKKGWEEDDMKNLLLVKPQTQVVVLGIQEIVTLDLGALLFPGRKKSENRAIELEQAVIAALAPAEWVAVESVTLVGLALLVLVRADLLAQVGEIWSMHVKAGIGGAAGNKGAVAIGFKLGSTPYTFVNVHLDSGTSRAEERGLQLQSILREVLTPQIPGITCLLGDFNFRVPQIDPETFFDFLESGRTLELLGRDEYLSGSAPVPKLLSQYFSEGEIRFPPTYKFQPGTINYTSERTPAWCDRIFYRGAQLSNYSAVLNVFSSDHKPVTASLVTAPLLRAQETPLGPNSAEEPEWVVLPPVDLLA